MDVAAQLERDAKARRELARAAGFSLIGTTAALEEGLGVSHGAGAITFALVAFAARGRRLLRSAYLLIDADARDTAVPLFRVMSEYLIVGRWLHASGDDAHRTWAAHDLRERLTTLREVAADSKLDQDTKDTLLAEVASTEAALRRYAGDAAPLTKAAARKAGEPEPPPLQVMARAVDLGFAYSLSYRIQSQTDAHATPLAIDAVFDPGEGGEVVRPVPKFALEQYESYAYGAHLLLDIVRPLADLVPELGWEPSITAVSETLAAITRAAQAADARATST